MGRRYVTSYYHPWSALLPWSALPPVHHAYMHFYCYLTRGTAYLLDMLDRESEWCYSVITFRSLNWCMSEHRDGGMSLHIITREVPYFREVPYLRSIMHICISIVIWLGELLTSWTCWTGKVSGATVLLLLEAWIDACQSIDQALMTCKIYLVINAWK